MIQLPHNCRCSAPAVTPRNWEKLSRIKGPWRIHCRFYDPTQLRPFMITDKNMNEYQNMAERKEATRKILKDLSEALEKGYNPWKGKIIPAQPFSFDISPTTYFIEALYKALERIKIEEKTKKEIKNYIIANLEKAAKVLNYDYLTIAEVESRHIIFALDHIREVSRGFSDNTFNHFRKYLMMLFKELRRIQAVKVNVIKDMDKLPVDEKEQRAILTKAERQYVSELLQTSYPEFFRFLNIFFHSGARISELMKLKKPDVDIAGQRFRSEIKKGRKTRIVWRPIKNIAVQFWKEAIADAAEKDYLFSKGLKPGATAIHSYQITKRWYRLIMQKEHTINGKKQKIHATFYSLKHINSTEMVDQYGIEVAASLNAHSSTSMVAKVYDIKSKDRINEKIRQANNSF
jgi:integrase